MISIYALKRKHKKLQEEYDLKGEELRRLRKAHTIETDPSQKFKFEKQIEQLDQKRKQLKQELEELEYLFEHPEKIPPFQWDYKILPLGSDTKDRIESLARYFVGRQDTVKKIDQFIQTHKSGYLAIVGRAGIGKSALLAHEVKKRGAVHHFVDDKYDSSKSWEFLKSIVKQLHQKYSFEFEKGEPYDIGGWAELYKKWIKEVSEEEQLVIFVDALDEAQHYGGDDSLLKYLPSELPENVYFILTSRPEFKKEHITLSGSTIFERYDLPPLTQADIEVYLQVRSTHFTGETLAEAMTTNQELTAILYQKSKGNPLYLYYLLQECKSENLTLEQINQLPQGLTKFYEKQWRERIWIGDKATKEGRKQILCLLLILKEPPNEEMLLELTNFDRAELQEYLTPLRRFMRTGERYEIFHDSFKNFISQQVEKTIPVYHEQLIGKLWNWQELKGKLARYALLWLPTHLLEAKQYEKIFPLARETAFQKTQVQAFPDNPALPLRTVQTALQGAADADKAVEMTEFLLAHARQAEELKRENPLEALRNGTLNRAWKLADLFEIERCALWHLLLAWELKDTDRLEQAQATLERLREKGLPYLSGWQGEYAAHLLFQVFGVSEDAFNALQQRLLEDKDRRVLSKLLSACGHFAAAVEIAQRMEWGWIQAQVLGAIAQAQAEAGEREAIRATLAVALEAAQRIDEAQFRAAVLGTLAQAQAQAGESEAAQTTFATALETAQRIDEARFRAAVLGTLAQAQAQAGESEAARTTFVAALETAQKINEVVYRIGVLRSIAQAQTQTGELASALATTQKIEWPGDRASALGVIAQAQAQAGEGEAARATFTMALAIAQRIFWAEDRSPALQNIAHAQAQAGESEAARATFAAARETAQKIQKAEDRSPALRNIAHAQAQAGESEAARATFAEACEAAQRIDGAEHRAGALRSIAQAQAQTGELVSACGTVQRIDGARYQASALGDIAQVQAQAGESEAARTTLAKALTTTQRIDDARVRAMVLKAIAQAQTQAGKREAARATFAVAQETAQRIYKKKEQAKVLGAIAQAQAQAGEREAARVTFATAQEIAQRIYGKKEQAEVLWAITQAQVQAGELIAASETAQRIDGAEYRILALRAIAQAQVQTREFSAALATAQKMKGGNRAKVLGTIAQAQAQAGEFSVALETVQRIDSAGYRASALRAIAQAQAQAGESEAARVTFTAAIENVQEIIDKGGYWTSELKSIAQAQAQVGAFTAAIETVQRIDSARYRASALGAIAQAQAQAGESEAARVTFTAAIETAQWIDDAGYRASALRAIAQAQAQIGEGEASRVTFTAAIEATQEINKALNRALALKDIAEAQAQIELFPAALETARRIETAWFRTDALQVIAEAQAQAGEFTASLKIAQGIDEARYRARDLLRNIAQVQAKAGFSEQAVRTAEMILTDRNEHLPEIAEILVAVGDKVHFKRLLIPCASYLDAAYRMCGLLAQLYPEQATAIAKLVISRVKGELDVN